MLQRHRHDPVHFLVCDMTLLPEIYRVDHFVIATFSFIVLDLDNSSVPSSKLERR